MACATASYVSLYEFPAEGSGVPRKGLLGLRFLRNVAKAAVEGSSRSGCFIEAEQHLNIVVRRRAAIRASSHR